MPTESLQDSDPKTYKICQNPCNYELLVIFINYKDLFAKVHYVAFLTYSKTETKWIFIIYGKFYPKLIYNLYIFKFT